LVVKNTGNIFPVGLPADDINSDIRSIITNSPATKSSKDAELNSDTDDIDSDPVLSVPSNDLPSAKLLPHESSPTVANVVIISGIKNSVCPSVLRTTSGPPQCCPPAPSLLDAIDRRRRKPQRR